MAQKIITFPNHKRGVLIVLTSYGGLVVCMLYNKDI